MQTLFNRISFRNITGNILLLTVTYLLILLFFPLTSETPFIKYNQYFAIYIIIWIFSGFAHWKYYSDKQSEFRYSIRAFYSDFIAFVIAFLGCNFFELNISAMVLACVSGFTLLLELTVISFTFTFKNAKKEISKSDLQKNTFDKESFLSGLTQKQVDFFQKYTNFEKEQVTVLDGDDMQLLLNEKEKKALFCPFLFNRIKKPALFLAVANQKIEKEGFLIGCFETKSARKRRILLMSSSRIKYLYYAYDLYKRFLTHCYLTSGLMYLLYNHTDNVYSKTEVFGRLYCAGFEYADSKKINGNIYFVFKKVALPQRIKEVSSGLLIGLERIGKHGNTFIEYKLRTMYPYSEFLQSFMIKNNSLQRGGKINHDIRITRFGMFARRCWLDEIPQFVNLLKGDMKLVGVRPLSKNYYSLYSSELQQKRIMYKPGILPPYYADMPETMEQIQNSELRYLKACDEKGTFCADLQYLWRIFKNIVFNKARSK